MMFSLKGETRYDDHMPLKKNQVRAERQAHLTSHAWLCIKSIDKNFCGQTQLAQGYRLKGLRPRLPRRELQMKTPKQQTGTPAGAD
jgi:hypothetical protein